MFARVSSAYTCSPAASDQSFSNKNSAEDKAIPSDSVIFVVLDIHRCPFGYLSHHLHAPRLVVIVVSSVSIGHIVAAHHHSGVDVLLLGTGRGDGARESDDVEARCWRFEVPGGVHDVRLVVVYDPVVDQCLAGVVVVVPARRGKPP